MTTVSVLGAGRMGSALVRALLNHGFDAHVWNRTPEKVKPLVDIGATVAASVDDAITVADIVIVNLIDYQASDAHLRSPPNANALKGKVLVQLTSGSPNQAREAGEWATEKGIVYLDGAIMATPNFIGEPSATTLYSGSRRAFEEHEKVLGALGTAAYVGEDFGHASALDTGLLSQLWGRLFGTLQAIAVCQAEGIDLDVYARHLKPFKPIIDLAVDDLLVRARDGRVRSDDQTLASIAAHYGAFQHLVEVSAEHGLNCEIPDAFESLFKAAIAAGHLQDDFAALVRFMR